MTDKIEPRRGVDRDGAPRRVAGRPLRLVVETEVQAERPHGLVVQGTRLHEMLNTVSCYYGLFFSEIERAMADDPDRDEMRNEAARFVAAWTSAIVLAGSEPT